jgi:MFS family permease
VLLVAAFLVGGTSNPLYSLLIAYTNDFLDRDDMASASGGMLFINGLGAIAGPLITGWMMGLFGSPGYFLLIAILMIALALYAGYRMTQRRAPPVSETATYTPISPTATSVALDVAREHAINTADSGQDRTKSA